MEAPKHSDNHTHAHTHPIITLAERPKFSHSQKVSSEALTFSVSKMSTLTPGDDEDGPVELPDTQDWYWACCECRLKTPGPPTLSTYGLCKKCRHERCRLCRVTWATLSVSDTWLLIPSPAKAGGRKSLGKGKENFEIGSA
ncbi:hypothetical protein BGZ60DRAFT_230611 [Tricladium varicosporioides]|nr:hypothetical protein BGZ60DRAFT_230611 [Hymenoscyphus varicosporioides]